MLVLVQVLVQALMGLPLTRVLKIPQRFLPAKLFWRLRWRLVVQKLVVPLFVPPLVELLSVPPLVELLSVPLLVEQLLELPSVPPLVEQLLGPPSVPPLVELLSVPLAVPQPFAQQKKFVEQEQAQAHLQEQKTRHQKLAVVQEQGVESK